jgi:nitroreductase
MRWKAIVPAGGLARSIGRASVQASAVRRPWWAPERLAFDRCRTGRRSGGRPTGGDVETNPVIEAMLRRKSIRTFTDEAPTREVIEAVVRAGQQAPFAAQLGSVLLKRDREASPFGAPLLFTVCVDVHRMERVMQSRQWRRAMCDLWTLLLGIQDAAYMAQNMVQAAESLGLGSCFLGATPCYAERIIEEYGLPPRVFPLVQLAMGYPAEDPPVRPRYPIEFTLFEDRYPELDEASVERATAAMDEGYLVQDYYRTRNARLPLRGGRKETSTYDDYSWTEHISRKLGQWEEDPGELLHALKACGFDLGAEIGEVASE